MLDHLSSVVFFNFLCSILSFFFFFNDTATTEIYTLSLHDALPIYAHLLSRQLQKLREKTFPPEARFFRRSEEHTSELQSHLNLVCRLLLEKKKKTKKRTKSQVKTGETQGGRRRKDKQTVSLMQSHI